MRRHDPSTCTNPECTFCEGLAEALADDIEPDFDESGAADQYERSLG